MGMAAICGASLPLMKCLPLGWDPWGGGDRDELRHWSTAINQSRFSIVRAW